MKKLSKPGPLLAPLPVVMATCGDMENSNIITIGWTGIINTKPPMTYISVQPIRHSYNIIRESGEFVINCATQDIIRATDYCGVKSGRDVDKFAELGLTKEAATVVQAPMIAESPVNIECKVIEAKELGSHTMFMAEIVAVHVDDRYVDEDGAYDYGSMKFIAYNHGKYYALEQEPMGFFGYSVMKPKTVKRKAAEAGARRRASGRAGGSSRRAASGKAGGDSRRAASGKAGGDSRRNASGKTGGSRKRRDI